MSFPFLTKRAGRPPSLTAKGSYRPTDGVREDFKKLVNSYLVSKTVRYEVFSNLWRQKKMSFLCAGRLSDREAREFFERCVEIAKEYFLPPYQFQVRVVGLYLLYGLFQTQVLIPKVKIRLTVAEWEDSLVFKQQAAQQSHLDVVYVFNKLLHESAFLFCHSAIEMSVRSFRLETEDGEVSLAETLKEDKSAVTDLFNYESMEQLSYLLDHYQQMKISFAGPGASRPEKSLDFVQGGMVEDLVVLLQSFKEDIANVGKRQAKKNPEDDEEQDDKTKEEATGDRRKALKSQAYNSEVVSPRKSYNVSKEPSSSTAVKAKSAKTIMPKVSRPRRPRPTSYESPSDDSDADADYVPSSRLEKTSLTPAREKRHRRKEQSTEIEISEQEGHVFDQWVSKGPGPAAPPLNKEKSPGKEDEGPMNRKRRNAKQKVAVISPSEEPNAGPVKKSRSWKKKGCGSESSVEVYSTAGNRSVKAESGMIKEQETTNTSSEETRDLDGETGKRKRKKSKSCKSLGNNSSNNPSLLGKKRGQHSSESCEDASLTDNDKSGHLGGTSERINPKLDNIKNKRRSKILPQTSLDDDHHKSTSFQKKGADQQNTVKAKLDKTAKRESLHQSVLMTSDVSSNKRTEPIVLSDDDDDDDKETSAVTIEIDVADPPVLKKQRREKSDSSQVRSASKVNTEGRASVVRKRGRPNWAEGDESEPVSSPSTSKQRPVQSVSTSPNMSSPSKSKQRPVQSVSTTPNMSSPSKSKQRTVQSVSTSPNMSSPSKSKQRTVQSVSTSPNISSPSKSKQRPVQSVSTSPNMSSPSKSKQRTVQSVSTSPNMSSPSKSKRPVQSVTVSTSPNMSSPSKSKQRPVQSVSTSPNNSLRGKEAMVGKYSKKSPLPAKLNVSLQHTSSEASDTPGKRKRGRPRKVAVEETAQVAGPKRGKQSATSSGSESKKTKTADFQQKSATKTVYQKKLFSKGNDPGRMNEAKSKSSTIISEEVSSRGQVSGPNASKKDGPGSASNFCFSSAIKQMSKAQLFPTAASTSTKSSPSGSSSTPRNIKIVKVLNNAEAEKLLSSFNVKGAKKKDETSNYSITKFKML